MTQEDFDILIEDTSKTINGDIEWNTDEDHSPSVEFRAEITSDPGYPIYIRGSYNSLIDALTFAIIHKSVGRIYALDLGKDHHNPSCHNVGEKHKHRWTEAFKDKDAYVPDDITAEASDPVTVWMQFCQEACITHNGNLKSPISSQKELGI